eukprot:349929-Chlamydomonas_euryale.AAC.6
MRVLLLAPTPRSPRSRSQGRSTPGGQSPQSSWKGGQTRCSGPRRIRRHAPVCRKQAERVSPLPLPRAPLTALILTGVESVATVGALSVLALTGMEGAACLLHSFLSCSPSI